MCFHIPLNVNADNSFYSSRVHWTVLLILHPYKSIIFSFVLGGLDSGRGHKEARRSSGCSEEKITGRFTRSSDLNCVRCMQILLMCILYYSSLGSSYVLYHPIFSTERFCKKKKKKKKKEEKDDKSNFQRNKMWHRQLRLFRNKFQHEFPTSEHLATGSKQLNRACLFGKF